MDKVERIYIERKRFIVAVVNFYIWASLVILGLVGIALFFLILLILLNIPVYLFF